MIDTNLIKRCQSGDGEAFNSLYISVYKKAVWTTRLLCGNPDKTEDIVQEAFYECFRDIGKLRNAALFQAWFNRILVRKCGKLTRNKYSVDSLDDKNAPELKDDINVSDIVEANQTCQRVREAIGRLSAPLRTTIVLYYYNELSIREIAKVMDCFQGTVKSRLHYAKEKLGKELENEINPGSSPIFAVKPEEGAVYE